MQRRHDDVLRRESIIASAPCRIDMGGTLDISSFYYPLAYVKPSTFNIALSMRTRVSLSSYKEGYVKISSKGFEDAVFPILNAPFDHPMGLMFAIAAYFQMDGIHIDIQSASPPRSALGGSSVAAVGLVAALGLLLEKAGGSELPRDMIPLLAHGIEESVAGIPCGLQDQLAALYGGINAWQWKGRGDAVPFIRNRIADPADYALLSRNLLVAYCGIPHESKNINGIWVRQFISGKSRGIWLEIAELTRSFINAFDAFDFSEAAGLMNRETDLRLQLTPDVLDAMGMKLATAARRLECGARFTGAGGGGCVWALGAAENIMNLKPIWSDLLSETEAGYLLDVDIDSDGLLTETKQA